MRSATLLAALVVLAVVFEVVLPGRAVYHAGWYNVGLAALAMWAIAGMRRAPLVAFGVGAIAFAGIASGLLGPDTRTVIGAPGTSLKVDEAGGAMRFPPLHAQPIAAWRYTATALLRSVPRTVLGVEAFDQRGAHLTITQPTGSAFLSPVLLMENTQTIAGFSLPYDTFAVPAAHRVVKAVLFSAAQAASIPALSTIHGPVVLFDLEDETGAPVRHGIGVAPDGQAVLLGGLRLRASVLSYPAIEVVSIPDLAVVAAGFLALFIGVLLTRRRAAG